MRQMDYERINGTQNEITDMSGIIGNEHELNE